MPPRRPKKQPDTKKKAPGKTDREASADFSRVALIRNVVIVVVLLGFAVYFERPNKTELSNGRCDLVEADASDKSEAEYARLASSGYRDVRTRRVTVIPLRAETDPGRVLGSVCEQRWYLAKLVDALDALGPTEIVFDKFFSQDACEESDAGTIDLISAVQKSPVPVIVGRATHPPKSDPNNSCLILTASLDFGNKRDASGIPTNRPAADGGLTRLNSDIRKVPLSWSCYSSDAAFDAGEKPTNTTGTLSWAAASMADTGLKNESRLTEFRTEGRHPLTSFIEPGALAHIEALSILCASTAKDEVASRYKVDCAQHPRDDTQIRGRIVVIGEDVPGEDQHMLFGKSVSGMYLQANYIESLLDDRFMKPMSPAWNLALFIVWLVFLYVIFWIQPEIALLTSLVILILIRFLLSQLVASTGLYPQIWVQDVGLIGLALKYIDSRGHLLVDRLKER